MKTFKGILDTVSFPNKITGYVVAPDNDPRIHGFAVQADLGFTCGFTQVIWLSLTGELPTVEEVEIFNRALVWLTPMHVGEGPTHAAVLAKVISAPNEVVPAVATIALGQRIKAELQELASFFNWLEKREGSLPSEIIEPEPSVSQLETWKKLGEDTRRWFGSQRAFEGLMWRREPTAYALFYYLGIRDEARLIALSTIARLSTILAEAACTEAGSIMRYPTKTPSYVYMEED